MGEILRKGFLWKPFYNRDRIGTAQQFAI